ncbi:MAG TPA: CRISPR-associated helicase Cas3' [Thermoanaerobaculia bacterium]|nr:CRISPR-associated helicase Cas3' [Thermoanaerobaculia bacterium]
MYCAHSAPTLTPTRNCWEPLRDHLLDVAERAACFASLFGLDDEARLAGLLHDLGKYSDLFTLRLEGKASGLDHWSAGARAVLDQLKAIAGPVALAIQGHHIGLQSAVALQDLQKTFRPRPKELQLTHPDAAVLLARLEADGISLPGLQTPLYDRRRGLAAAMLDVRMLFSSLVDADCLETEAHFKRGCDGLKVHRPAAPKLRAGEALAALDAHLAHLAKTSRAASTVNALRADLLESCREAGALKPGLFTLSAPTGAGKTLAMLAFALRHAAENELRRIVLAVPFLSIIEQTVRVYRELLAPVFGDDYLLEHHSLAGTRGTEQDGQDEADLAARRRAENWDAPLIVTTSVQLLESLFANRPSACRKLHRLAGSVILLDEVQTLPPNLAVPTLAGLSQLAHRYGASIVFATATQPAFEHLDEYVRPLAASGWQPKEIVPVHLNLFDRARRTRVLWQADTPRSWDSLAEELAGVGSALCIVNLKKHALELANRLQQRGVPGLFHLSTNLCPAHRELVLAAVRQRLDERLPCILISTQCVEAGVDVDFPLVLRALGPLDAIAQAAGRCNRNGLMPEQGEVRVFLPEDARYPPGGYEAAAQVTRALLRQRGSEAMDLQSPKLFNEYYQKLYDLTGIATGERGRTKDLLGSIALLDFEETARLYRLIDQDAINVVVPWDSAAFRELRDDLRKSGRPTRRWLRRARPHAVNLYRPKPLDPLWAYLDPASSIPKEDRREDWFLLLDEKLYDREMLGLTGAPEVWIA